MKAERRRIITFYGEIGTESGRESTRGGFTPRFNVSTVHSWFHRRRARGDRRPPWKKEKNITTPATTSQHTNKSQDQPRRERLLICETSNLLSKLIISHYGWAERYLLLAPRESKRDGINVRWGWNSRTSCMSTIFFSRSSQRERVWDNGTRTFLSLSCRVFADFNFVIKREKLNSAERMRRDWRMENGEVGL